MLISTWAPPPVDALLGVADQGEICHPNMQGLRQVTPDPFSAAVGGIPSIVGAVQSILGTSPAQRIAKEQQKLEAAQIKAEKQAAAQQFALDQLQADVSPSEQRRQSEIYALYAVGGIAAIITLTFILKAGAKKGSEK